MTLLGVEEAQRRLLSLAAPLGPESVPLHDAVGRWVRENVSALRDQPARDLSAMDGYAIRFAEQPGPWRVVGESAAGASFGKMLAPGEAVRIFTGASVPAGADTILLQEDATVLGHDVFMEGAGPPSAGAYIRQRGMDFQTGDLILAAGEPIDARRLALAAMGGHGSLTVCRRPRVTLISTGDELVPPGQPVPDDRLPSSNAPMLAGLLAHSAIALRDQGIVPDALDAVSSAFREAATDADVIVTTGGVSVGDRDMVRPALAGLGARLDFWRVAMRPGKPLLAGTLGNAIVLGLPGNPVSCYVTARLFLLPLLAQMGGAAAPLPRPRRVLLGMPLPANGARQDYLRARVDAGIATVPDLQDSSQLVALARSDGLIVRAPHAAAAEIGEPVDLLAL